MDTYSNKINRIKNTIDEIRDDIEKMKMVFLLNYIILLNIFIFNRKMKKQ